MLNLVEMILEVTEKVRKFEEETVGSIEKTYGEKLEKIAAVEREIAELPNTCAGKSKTFIDKKRKLLNEKLDKLRESAEAWYDKKKKEIKEKVEQMLSSGKEAAQNAMQAEKESEAENENMVDDMVSK